MYVVNKKLFLLIMVIGALLIPTGIMSLAEGQNLPAEIDESTKHETTYELKLKDRDFTPSPDIVLDSVTAGLSQNERGLFL